MAVCGLINLNKPAGVSSRQAVNGIARLARPGKVGHAGTLDPIASGVLVVGVGGATRLIEYVQRMPKTYRATFLLGRRSATEDIEGEVVELVDAPIPSLGDIELATGRFVGPVQQRPPAFSAIKVAGRRAYDLARRGREVVLPARPVMIHRIEIVEYCYPQLVLRVECGSGTYIRSLGRDLAEALGTAAVMSALVRTAIGPFRIEEAVKAEELASESWRPWIQPALRAVEYLPRMRLSAQDATRLRNGLRIDGSGLVEKPMVPYSSKVEESVAGEMAAVDETGQLIGIVVPAEDGSWRTERNLPTGQGEMKDEG